MSRHGTGFTLVEVLVATGLGSLVVMVALGAMEGLSRSQRTLQRTDDLQAEGRVLGQLLRRDLRNARRGADPSQNRIVVHGDRDGRPEDVMLRLQSLWQGPVRPGRAESDHVEIEYRLQRRADRLCLLRRIWPNPDRRREEPGGLLTRLSDRLEGLQIRCFDGRQWLTEWSEPTAGWPQAVEVSVALADDGGRRAATSVLVAWSRNQGSEALKQRAARQGGEQEPARPGEGPR